jgi:dihydroneopterin aldolase
MAHVGVTDQERAAQQALTICLGIEPLQNFQAMSDEIAHTIDYASVCERVTALADARPRRLIETLADEIASAILIEFSARSVDVEVRKFILPETRYVAVRCRRSSSHEENSNPSRPALGR